MGCRLPIPLFLCRWMSCSLASGQQHQKKHFLFSPNTHKEVEKPSQLSIPQPLHCKSSFCASELLPVPSEHSRNPIAPSAAPRGTGWGHLGADPAASHLPSPLLCLPDCWKWYLRRNPLWKSSRASCSSAVSQKPLAMFLGALPPAPSPQHPF